MTLIQKIARSFDEKQWDKDEAVLADDESSDMQRIYVRERRLTFMKRAEAALAVIDAEKKAARQLSPPPPFIFAIFILAGFLFGVGATIFALAVIPHG